MDSFVHNQKIKDVQKKSTFLFYSDPNFQKLKQAPIFFNFRKIVFFGTLFPDNRDWLWEVCLNVVFLCTPFIDLFVFILVYWLIWYLIDNILIIEPTLKLKRCSKSNNSPQEKSKVVQSSLHQISQWFVCSTSPLHWWRRGYGAVELSRTALRNLVRR